jgi:dihydrofolate reductase
MRTINAFIFLTLNGYYKGIHDDINWHIHGEEGNEFSQKQLEADNILLFGRKTYDMMSGFWPTKMAYDNFSIVAERMNNSEKVVISNTLLHAEWNNTSILNGNIVDQIRELKASPGKNITILGSGTLVTQLTDAGLIDEYEFLIDPIAIGKGTPIFSNMNNQLDLILVSSSVFHKSGAILLTYKRK